MPFARDISAWTYLYGRNILYYFKKKVHFHILDVSRVLYAKKVKLPFTQKKRKDIFIPPTFFHGKFVYLQNIAQRRTIEF